MDIFDIIYSKILDGKLRGIVPHIDPISGKAINTENNNEISIILNEILNSKWLDPIASVGNYYDDRLVLSHIVIRKGDKLIAMCFIFNLYDLAAISVLMEVDECIWCHFKSRIGGYMYKEELIKVDAPIYTEIDIEGNILGELRNI